MRINDWAGVKNGDEFTVEQKAQARQRVGLPADLELCLALSGIDGITVGVGWFAGFLDLRVVDGMVQTRAGEEQAEAVRKVAAEQEQEPVTAS